MKTFPSISEGRQPMAMQLESFIEALERLTAQQLGAVADQLDAAYASAAGEVAWWQATVDIERSVRRQHCGRHAMLAAHRASLAVLAAARSAAMELPDGRVTLVARAAADVARGLVAGEGEPVDVLLREWRLPIAA
jgi:hypothetical protein